MSNTQPPAPAPSPLPPLPVWTSPASVLSWLVTLIALICGTIGAFHPGFSEPRLVQALVPSVAYTVAGAIGIFEAVTRRKASIAAIQAGVAPTVAR